MKVFCLTSIPMSPVWNHKMAGEDISWRKTFLCDEEEKLPVNDDHV
uniref:Uncharacterized protein n=1 Tax=Kalanchoe fedtschenkoi TaxID=63787 RepID=A0A7N0SWD7_KALFE